MIPVDGVNKRLTLYRTELATLTGVILVIDGILETQGGSNKQATGKVYSDYKSGVLKYNKLEGVRPYSIKQATEPEADLLQKLRVLKAQLPSGIEVDWVRLHQKKPLTSRKG